MNTSFPKLFIFGSLLSTVIWGGVTFFLLKIGFVKFAESYASEQAIQIGAVFMTIGLCLIVIFNFIGNGRLAKKVKKAFHGLVFAFAGTGFSALTSCVVFYWSSGWTTPMILYTIGGAIFWAASLVIIYTTANANMKPHIRMWLSVITFFILLLFCVLLYMMQLVGKV
ncbi:hypothetical protein [Pseudomonas haemolytica]|uniref:hypothetical protein n=1 Tax=Pseudomonas haemolytica TaxID=2600065 RepID=UPI00190BBCD6|nr:hypothetical protein [Pseudomonas haemolytica]MBK3451048.1 hypothetical protein [Pseudomonas haemolytica]